ncbi:SPFH domain-containing protein (plasmid) [Cetobacterium somerae]|uniref:SPFH domain-containing protein n=1 Tax=Cetobacterium somerae TaxID=188913 RepID=UPI002E7BA3C4|nr:SPFH domain-containing protein [Cetobacterium somerae]WVJ03149.1 SPFH domain-containing protein [Cetobacterium somerae]
MIRLILGATATVATGLVLSTYKKCPSDSLLVRYGIGGTKVLEGKGLFVIPFLQSHKLMSLNPHNLDIALDEDSGVATKDKIRIEVEADATFAVSKEEKERKVATERLLNFKQENTVALVKEILTGQLRSIVSEMNFEDLLENRKKLMEKVSESTEIELSKFGLDLMNFNIKMIKDLDGIVEQLGKKASAAARSGSEISIAEQEKNSATAIANSTKEKEVSIAKTNSEKTKQVVEYKIDESAAEQKEIAEIAELEYNTSLKKSNIKIETEKKIELNNINSKKEIELSDEKSKQEITDEKIVTIKKEYSLSLEEKRIEEITSITIENEANKLTAENELEIAKVTADKTLIIAEANAKAIKLEAEANASAETLPFSKRVDIEKRLVEIYGVDGALKIKLMETLPKLTEHYVDAMNNITIDSINVITNGNEDNRGAIGGEIGSTVNNLVSSIPMIKMANDLARGLNFPEINLTGNNKEQQVFSELKPLTIKPEENITLFKNETEVEIENQ